LTFLVDGEYAEAAGRITMRIDARGGAEVVYRFLSKLDEKTIPRQIGMVFYTPRACDTLAWKRKSQWSVYPEDHIGRPEGIAKAFRDASLPDPKYRERPRWPWALDQNALGTRDFRSTRRNIDWVSLTDGAGTGLFVRSDGRQHARAFVDGGRIGLLVAYYSTGGAGFAFGSHLKAEQLLLKPGLMLEDTIRLELGGPFNENCIPESPHAGSSR
jgi:hypothetical protein